MTNRIPPYLLFPILWLVAGPAMAQSQPESGETPDVQPEKAKRTWTFSFYYENDLFANTDQNYTNGTKISWISPDVSTFADAGTIPAFVAKVVSYFPLFNEEGIQRNVALSLGQNIYTPSDITISSFMPNDRPYAGWLYFGVALHSKTDRRLDTVEMNFGVVGPLSFAEEAQDFVHILRNLDRPKGWQYQLRNEPALNLIWERKYRFFRWEMGETPFGLDAMVHVGASIGNVYTYANTGIDLRMGWNIPSDFGASTIRLAGDTNAPSSNLDPRFSTQRPFSFHVFTGIDGRAVARDIFLDGNTFRDSHSVDKEPWVGDLALGASITIRNWKLSYAQVLRTKQYKAQNKHHTFGSINVSFSY
jgi:hypothetical protein